MSHSPYILPTFFLLAATAFLPSTLADVTLCSQGTPSNDIECGRLNNTKFGFVVGLPVAFPFLFFFIINYKDFLHDVHFSSFFSREEEDVATPNAQTRVEDTTPRDVEMTENRRNAGGYVRASARDDDGVFEVGDTFQIEISGNKMLGIKDNFTEGTLLSFIPSSSGNNVNFTMVEGNIWRVSQSQMSGQEWSFFGSGKSASNSELYLSVFGGQPSAGSLFVLTDREHAGRFTLEKSKGQGRFRVKALGFGNWYLGEGGDHVIVTRSGVQVTAKKVALSREESGVQLGVEEGAMRRYHKGTSL